MADYALFISVMGFGAAVWELIKYLYKHISWKE